MTGKIEAEMRAEMAEAANKIDVKVIDNELYVNASILPQFAATVAATHRQVMTAAAVEGGTPLTEAQNYALVGQQKLAMAMIILYEALLLKVETDQALMG